MAETNGGSTNAGTATDGTQAAPAEDVNSTPAASELEKFYQAAELKVEIVDGAGPAAARLKTMLGGDGRTLALRDYYPGE